MPLINIPRRSRSSRWISRPSQWLSRLALISLCLIAISAILVFTFVVIITEAKPSAQSPERLTSEQAKYASQFIKRVSSQIINAKQTVELVASEKEINYALNLVNRTYSGINGEIAIQQQKKAVCKLSLRLHIFGNPYFFNASAELLPSEAGLVWENGQLGNLHLSKRISNWLFTRFIHVMIGKTYGKRVIEAVEEINFKNDSLVLKFNPPENFQKGFADAAQRLSTYSGQPLDFNPERVQHYLDFLVDMARAVPNQRRSISQYLEAILRESKLQTEQHQSEAHRENFYALYALAVQTAPGFFRHFIADLSVQRLNATYQPQLILSDRSDLALHFIYSAGLHILSEQGVSFSMGEMKEFIDAGSGGSGFSFADITADRAGIHFAKLATTNENGAHFIQAFAKTGLEEHDFFPSIQDLPEGLSESQLKERFEHFQSPSYQALLDEIDRRIFATRLFKKYRYDEQK